METFIPYEINRATREQDKSKAESLGPMAYALSKLIDERCYINIDEESSIGLNANGKNILFRGVKLQKETLD
jgi:hypothetical protein